VQHGRPALAVVGVASLCWLAALGVAPLVRAEPERWPSTMRVASGLVYLAASRVCHQRPERSFRFGGAPLPVCARCTGTYVGAAFALMGLFAVGAGTGRRALRDSGQWLAVAAVPTACSIGSEWIGIALPMWTRALAAIPLGADIALVVGAWLLEAGGGGAAVSAARPGRSATLP